MYLPSQGVRISMILNKTSIEVFPLTLHKGKHKNEKHIKKLLEKFMDKYYDVIFVIGNVDENLALQEVHPNYSHVFDYTVISEKH